MLKQSLGKEKQDGDERKDDATKTKPVLLAFDDDNRSMRSSGSSSVTELKNFKLAPAGGSDKEKNEGMEKKGLRKRGEKAGNPVDKVAKDIVEVQSS